MYTAPSERSEQQRGQSQQYVHGTSTYLTPSAAVKCLPELDQAVQRRLPTALLGRAIEVYDQRAIPFFLKSPFAYFADSPFGIVSVFQPAPAKWRAR